MLLVTLHCGFSQHLAFRPCNENETKMTRCIKNRGICRFHIDLKFSQCVCLCLPNGTSADGIRCESSTPFSTCNPIPIISKLTNDMNQVYYFNYNNRLAKDHLENASPNVSLKLPVEVIVP